MVDFKVENAHLYIPKNLSYELHDYRRIHRDSLILQALQLSKRERLARKAVEEQQKQEGKINKAFITIFTLEERKRINALDLAFNLSRSYEVLTKANEICKLHNQNMTSKDSSFVNNSNCDSAIKQDSDSGKTRSKIDSLTSNLSENDIVFSEDHMRLSDIGYVSDIASHFSDSSDGGQSGLLYSDRGSVDSIIINEGNDDDLDRVTIDFSNKMDLSQSKTESVDIKQAVTVSDNIGIIANNPHVSNMDIINDTGVQKSNSSLVKKRLKEKELPKIKLLLSQSPANTNLLDLGLPSFQSEEESPENSPPAASGSLFTNQEFDFLETDKIKKRSTSLKTYKTPPGTPHRKKVVRFADAMGLDLEDVKTVMNMEDPPNIPESAMQDLKIGLEEEHKTEGTKYLIACFPQPAANRNFIQRMMDQKVMLENCLVDGQEMSINGTVRVANISFHKRVVVRYTVNDWVTFTDVVASYVQNSNDGATDRFSFTINVPNYFQIGDKLQMALMYDAGGQEFWDSNGGANYVIECYATAVPVLENDNTWMNFL